MSSREKDQADFDLETFVDLFDTAMSSDNPAVKKALKNLILISAMVNAQQDSGGLRDGPLRRVVEDIRNLNRRLSQLENAGAYKSTYAPNTTTTLPWTVPPGTIPPTTTIPPGQWNPNTNTWPTINPNTIPPGTIIGGTSTGYVSNQATNGMLSAEDINIKVGSLLDKLEAK